MFFALYFLSVFINSRIWCMEMKLDKIVTKIINPEQVIAGSLSQLSKTCGKSGCKCMREVAPAKHAYNQLSFTKAKRTQTLSIKKKDFKEVSQMSENYKILRQSVLDLGQINIELIRLHGLARAQEMMCESFERVRRLNADFEPVPALVKRLRADCDKWQRKSVKRQKESQKFLTKIRDLSNSRAQWKSKAIKAQEELNELKKTCKKSVKKKI